MKFARIIRFDKSDLNIYPLTAIENELAIVGTFSFFNLDDAKLNGKVKQAFSNGFLGVPSFGFSTFITVTNVKEDELQKMKNLLSRHFLELYNAPSKEHSNRAADDEINLMLDLCSKQDNGSLIAIERILDNNSIKENFRHLPKADSCAEQKIWTYVNDK